MINGVIGLHPAPTSSLVSIVINVIPHEKENNYITELNELEDTSFQKTMFKSYIEKNYFVVMHKRLVISGYEFL